MNEGINEKAELSGRRDKMREKKRGTFYTINEHIFVLDYYKNK